MKTEREQLLDELRKHISWLRRQVADRYLDVRRALHDAWSVLGGEINAETLEKAGKLLQNAARLLPKEQSENALAISDTRRALSTLLGADDHVSEKLAEANRISSLTQTRFGGEKK